MAPLLNPGDALVVSPPVGRQPRSGELVVVESEGEFITHRVLPGGRIKGDNLLYIDREVPSDRIVGHVIAVSKPGRQLDLQQGLWPLAGRLMAGLSRVEWAVVRKGSRSQRDRSAETEHAQRPGWRYWLGRRLSAATFTLRRVIVWGVLALDTGKSEPE